ncbi:unnamed protein product, partial [Ixodes pacificus]
AIPQIYRVGALESVAGRCVEQPRTRQITARFCREHDSWHPSAPLSTVILLVSELPLPARRNSGGWRHVRGCGNILAFVTPGSSIWSRPTTAALSGCRVDLWPASDHLLRIDWQERCADAEPSWQRPARGGRRGGCK